MKNYEALAVELVRALRGGRSCAELSRLGGYKSNAVQRWEQQECWPTAARFLKLHKVLRARAPMWITAFYNGAPAWSRKLEPTSPDAVAAFLRSLKGNMSILQLAKVCERNRYSVSRWFDGKTEPRLPDFLRLADAACGRLPDLIAALVDPAQVPSIRNQWTKLQLARQAAYEMPWSHGVLRALELEGAPTGGGAQRAWLVRHLQISATEVTAALDMLAATGQVTKGRQGYRLRSAASKVDTAQDAAKARKLKAAWLNVARQRLEEGQPGRFGYSVFAASRADLARIHQLHLAYVREVQGIIAASTPNECVALYSSQLLDLAGTDF